MSGRIELPPLYLNETAVVPQTGWDFTKFLALGETISGSSVTVTVFSGTDPSPATVFISKTVVGNIVYPLLLGQVVGVIYSIQVQVNTSASQVLTLTGYLVVLPNLP